MDDTEEMRLTGGTLLHPHARTVMIVVLVVRVLVAGTSALTLGVQFHLWETRGEYVSEIAMCQISKCCDRRKMSFARILQTDPF